MTIKRTTSYPLTIPAETNRVNPVWTVYQLEKPNERNMNSVNNDVALFPNPASTKVNITAKDAIKAITILTMTGEEVFSKAGTHRQSETVAIGILPAG